MSENEFDFIVVGGGCSSINGMIYTRGQRGDYDEWAALPGCDGWSYGELNVKHVEMKYPITDVYMDAAESVGIKRLEDINGVSQDGIGYMQVTMKDGCRWSSADAFLSPEVRRRSNLSIEGFKLQRRIYESDVFQEHATHEILPGPSVQTDEEILDFWRRDAMSTYHPVGSAKMCPSDDPGAVVDNELRVHGIEGLRVVDCSVFPLIPSGNTHAPVVAVAGRAADLILGKPVLQPGA